MTTQEGREDRRGTEPRPAARRAEMLAALSLAIDLGLGQPMEHVLRATALSMRLADVLGLDAEDRATAYYANLVTWIGCNADSHELRRFFGDDIGFRADSYFVDWAGLPLMRLFLDHLAPEEPALRRGARQAAFLVAGRPGIVRLITSHCVSAGALADRLGLPRTVRTTIQQVFERWDGGGLPQGLRGGAITLPIRVVQLADVAEVHLRERGPAAAREVARRRNGTQFDPAVVDALLSLSEDELAALLAGDAWQTALALAPDRDGVLTDEGLDEVLLALGDFADLKSPCTAGHSRGVAELAAEAGRRYGLPARDVHELHRAGLVHDLGRTGVSNALWERPGPLSLSERERVRLHPYLTERILGRVPGLAGLARVAGAHHERMDGSGYPRGDAGADLLPQQRLLAAADCYHALREPRPHRPAVPPDEAARTLREEARAGRLDAQAVDAVLTAAGHGVGRRPPWPAGLTTREVEVLRLVAQGLSNREIADRLVLTTKTVRNHVERAYAKVGATNRTGATLYALQHGLIRHFPYGAP
jgi:HD-GYP domain-containing protein (c-di-GMP phosphodiesterase class II)